MVDIFTQRIPEISIMQVMNAVDEVIDATKCNGTSSCQNGKMCTHDLWHDLNIIVEDYLDKITIESLVETKVHIKVKEIN